MRLKQLLSASVFSSFALLSSSCGPGDSEAAKQSNHPAKPSSVASHRDDVRSTPLNPRSKGGTKLFTNLPATDTGIDFDSKLVDPTTHPMRRLYASSMVVGGMAVGDVDGDDKPDLYFVNGPGMNQLYKQTADFKFEEITDKAKVDGGKHWGVGTAMVDIDNDDDLDIYVCNHGSPNQLFINDGKGVFTEEAKTFGLDLTEASHTPAFCDYDLDGHLDLYLLTNKYYHPKGKLPENTPVATFDRNRNVILKPEYEPYLRITEVKYPPDGGLPVASWEDAGRPDYFYKNNGNGKFTNVTKKAGIESHGWGLSATWWDYNDDGYPDLYIGNDFDSPDYLYHNNGDGTFKNIIEHMVPYTTWFSMGADFADLNQDGWFDFLIADMSGTNHYKQKTTMGAMSDSAEFLGTAFPRQYMRNVLYVGTGQERFMEGAKLAGLSGTDWTWTVKICDFDNDGLDDVYFTNGMSKNYNDSDNPEAVQVIHGETQWDRHVRAGTPELREQNIAYRGKGDLHFEDVSEAWGLDHMGMSFSSVHADLDRDGDLDLVVVNLEEPASVYRNDSQEGNTVLVSLVGRDSNPQGIGARVTVEAGGKNQRRQNITMRGYMASQEPILHFGLGQAETIDRLIIDWPSGKRSELTNLAVNQHHEISEPKGEAPNKPWARKLPEPSFKAVPAVASFKHTENLFDDFKDQPLLPNKQSQYGPGVAVGDIDRDGDEDMILSGALLKAVQIGRNDGSGRFTSVNPPDPKAPQAKENLLLHSVLEDMGLMLFEADGDGDLDLYVVSGGSEHKMGTKQEALLQDRLYKNDGKGNFVIDRQALPVMTASGGVVVTADWDRDGDLDLFVGGRVVGGRYPTTPESMLLLNENGRFRKITEQAAPGLARSGMVTGALFTDADNDGWQDLLVTYEWGPIRYWYNDKGRFSDHTNKAGLAELLGWWNSIAGADFDGDGDTDYVVGNFGHNTKYHASPKKPALLYYGDIDQSGTKRLIEAEFEDATLFPVRGRSCSTHAIPSLANKFDTYHDFALAPLQEIYAPHCLEEAIRLEIRTLDTGVLINNGGRFEFKVLPTIAQIAPVYGMAAQEIDGDGIPDILLVQNFYGPQVETGHMDGGVGAFLKGKGDGTFDLIAPAESGFVAPKDCKGLAVTDLNGDARPDFLIARNNDTMLAFQNQTSAGRCVSVALHGTPGNPTAIGSKVTLITQAGRSQTAEVYGGSGYLSQSTANLTFGMDENDEPASVTVRWPNGATKDYTSGLSGTTIDIKP